MLAIAIAGVAIPERSLWQIGAQAVIDGLDGVENMRIVGRAQAETDESQGIRTEHVGCRQ